MPSDRSETRMNDNANRYILKENKTACWYKRLQVITSIILLTTLENDTENDY